jgi:hypothetical protein
MSAQFRHIRNTSPAVCDVRTLAFLSISLSPFKPANVPALVGATDNLDYAPDLNVAKALKSS